MDAKTYEVISVHSAPLLEIGNPGTFDDCGIMPSCVLTKGSDIYLYYVGWNRDYRLPYELSIGLAISSDGGDTFRKASTGPILGRDFQSPYFNASPSVISDGNIFKMYYISCTEWEHNDLDGWVPRYLVECAESEDGISWKRHTGRCIDYKRNHEAIARPCVLKDCDKYYMWYSYRDTRDFRRNKDNAYMIGFAESTDGFNWTRRDNDVGIAKSESGWDSEMMCYASVFENEGRLVMLYNGNEHGKYAIGYATANITA